MTHRAGAAPTTTQAPPAASAPLEAAIKLSAEMIQRRDDLRRLLGASYQENVTAARQILTGYARENGLKLAIAALDIAKAMDARRLDPSLVFAALVEECEARA